MSVLEFFGYLMAVALAIPFLGAACVLVYLLHFAALGWGKNGAPEEQTESAALVEEPVNAERAE